MYWDPNNGNCIQSGKNLESISKVLFSPFIRLFLCARREFRLFFKITNSHRDQPGSFFLNTKMQPKTTNFGEALKNCKKNVPKSAYCDKFGISFVWKYKNSFFYLIQVQKVETKNHMNHTWLSNHFDIKKESTTVIINKTSILKSLLF